MKKIITLIVSLFIAGFSFCQISNLNGGAVAIGDSSWVSGEFDTLTVNDVFFHISPHGSFAFHDSSVTLDMSSGNWSAVTNPTNNLFITIDANMMTFDGDTMTITVDGDYMMDISLSFSGTAGDDYEISFFKNAVLVDQSMERSTSQTDIGNVSMPIYLIDLVAGDDICFKIRNTASNDDATIISCSWIVWLLHY